MNIEHVPHDGENFHDTGDRPTVISPRRGIKLSECRKSIYQVRIRVCRSSKFDTTAWSSIVVTIFLSVRGLGVEADCNRPWLI